MDNEDVIAPYWNDIDITYTGNVFFKESTENEILDEITNEIRNVNSRLADFKALWAFIVTWDHVVQNSNFNNNQKVAMLMYWLTTCTSVAISISGTSGVKWPLLNLRSLHKNLIFATEDHFSLTRCPVTFSSFLHP